MARIGATLSGMAVGVGVGMAGTVLANKVGVPIVAGWLGASRGLQVLDDLISDHKAVMAALREMELTTSGEMTTRAKLFVKVKAALTAHALAEETVVYPVLRDVAGEDGLARELYEEHAQMKVYLSELERIGINDMHWAETALRLRSLVEEHARKEEDRAFPSLRQRLGPDQAATLGSGVMREKVSFL
jgi:hemerythrin superfamily protein